MPENSYCAKALKSVITIVIDDNSPTTRDEMQCCKKCLIGSKNEMSCNLSGLIPMEKFEEFSFGMFGVDSFYSRFITNLPLIKTFGAIIQINRRRRVFINYDSDDTF